MTRKELSLVLAVNAVTKPVNVLAPAVVLVAALVLGALWLAPVAAVCWVALVTVTFFDEREARAVAERERAERRVEPPRSRPGAFAPEIGSRVRAAHGARAAIRLAVEESVSPLDDVAHEVETLVSALEGHAARAQRMWAFLAEESPAALRARVAREPSDAVRSALEAKLVALERLERRLNRLLEEMDHVVATLETVHAEILATDGLEQGTLAGQVSALRENVQAVSAGLEDVFIETQAH